VLLRLLLLFTVVPLVELALLVWIGRQTSLWFTLGLVVATGLAGAWLARYQGFRCWRRVQQDLVAGALPADALVDGLMILLAGALLITPGVLTDLLGFALLLPPFRRLLRGYLKRRLVARFFVACGPRWGPSAGPPPRDEIIDVKVLDSRPGAAGEDRPS